MNGNIVVAKNVAVVPGEAADQIASLKERMIAAQARICLLLDETATLGLKWNLNIRTDAAGRHVCDVTLVREY